VAVMGVPRGWGRGVSQGRLWARIGIGMEEIRRRRDQKSPGVAMASLFRHCPWPTHTVQANSVTTVGHPSRWRQKSFSTEAADGIRNMTRPRAPRAPSTVGRYCGVQW
jgi:hypothetical protein